MNPRKPFPFFLAGVVLFALSEISPAQTACGDNFPWTVTGTDIPGGVVVNVCGHWAGCFPHDPYASVSGSQIQITFNAGGGIPGCQCTASDYPFSQNVFVPSLPAGTYAVTVSVWNCGDPQPGSSERATSSPAPSWRFRFWIAPVSPRSSCFSPSPPSGTCGPRSMPARLRDFANALRRRLVQPERGERGGFYAPHGLADDQPGQAQRRPRGDRRRGAGFHDGVSGSRRDDGRCCRSREIAPSSAGPRRERTPAPEGRAGPCASADTRSGRSAPTARSRPRRVTMTRRTTRDS